MYTKYFPLAILGIHFPLIQGTPIAQYGGLALKCNHDGYRVDSHEDAEGPPVTGSKACVGNSSKSYKSHRSNNSASIFFS